MYYVHVSYATGASTVRRSVAYIAHREEGLPGGRTRDLYGLGARYRGLRGDERAAVRELTKDGAELSTPRYYKIKLTVDNEGAKRLSRLGEVRAEAAMRDAVDRTFRGAFRSAQGVFVVHRNESTSARAFGKRARPFGNPHVHVFLSPLTPDGKTYFISRRRLALLKERWEREVGRVLDRRERGPNQREKAPRLAERLALARRLGRAAAGRGGADVLRGLPGALGRAGRLQQDIADATTTPERVARRLAFDLLSRFIPAPMRPTAEVLRRLGRLIPRG